MVVRLLMGIGVGACLGVLMGYLGKCSSGACPLMMNPCRGAVYGGIVGALFAIVLAGSLRSAQEATRAEEGKPTNGISAPGATEPARQDVLVHVNNAADFDRYVLRTSKPCLADFYSDRCGPCRMLAPIIEDLARKYQGRAVVCKVNLDSAPRLAARYNITGIPAVLFFERGQEVHRLIGLRRRDDYKVILEMMIGKRE